MKFCKGVARWHELKSTEGGAGDRFICGGHHARNGPAPVAGLTLLVRGADWSVVRDAGGTTIIPVNAYLPPDDYGMRYGAGGSQSELTAEQLAHMLANPRKHPATQGGTPPTVTLSLAARDDDVVIAGGGNDTVLAGLGADLIDGGDGNDGLTGMQGADIIAGGAGDDTSRAAILINGSNAVAHGDGVLDKGASAFMAWTATVRLRASAAAKEVNPVLRRAV